MILSAGELGGEMVDWPVDANGQPLPEAVFMDSEGRQLRYVLTDWTTPAQGVFAGEAA
ncbi:MAG: hypothetical protein HZB85_01905 [Deltaproteobacteria bacterium]|nr:hypothetical protein [Deltaproteobacteria bacterium]